MEKNLFLNNPAIKNMDPRKLAIIIDLIKEADGKPINKSLPFLLKANTKLKEHKLSFSSEETALIMGILTNNMSKEEKEKLYSLKSTLESNASK